MKLEDIRASRDSKIAMFVNYFSVIMAIFYFVCGLAFLYLPWFTSVNTTSRYAIAILLLIYGLFRAYRIYYKIKKDKENQHDEETV
ncbi:MAG: hypothetical protein MUC81_12565 [Bacteroidia bacterium]|nr:hypothetical protein [Bacteroidia bacterium]